MTLRESADAASRRFIVVEGYDGAGKSTLIRELQLRFSERSIRVVGRKSEQQLVDIARILEREDRRPDLGVEMLLRIAVEFERLKIISESLLRDELVVCDRGLVSLVSWFNYLDVPREPYDSLIAQLSEYYRSALTIVCQADFDTCWSRSSNRGEQSRKDRLGKDINSGYFSQYESNVRTYADSGADVIFINTVATDVESVGEWVRDAIKARGI